MKETAKENYMIERTIRSSSNPYIKYLNSLRLDPKRRQEENYVVISGVKLITDLAVSMPIASLIIDEQRPLHPSFPVDEIIYVPLPLLKKMTGLAHPEPWAAKIALQRPPLPTSLSHLLILDHIQDPGNLGTLFRTARALSWDGIFLTEGSTDPLGDKALRASQGSVLELPYIQGNITQLEDLLRDHHLTPLVASAQGSLGKAPSKVALILGNEAHGPSPSLEGLGKKIGIPIDHVESLNVAIAGGILMYLLRSA